MPYIGNTIRAADDYRLIDDISSGFNGSTTSFALQVAGSAPVPFPKSPQQVLISVNGVIQEPDPTGSSGFNLVGTNIVFSSAPTNGHAFFGIIYATADYLNAGGNFPAGSLGAPSLTFIGDENTGLYRKGSGSVGFVSDATEIANTDSNGLTISSGDLILGDNRKAKFGAGDDLQIFHDGTSSILKNTTGSLFVQNDNTRIVNAANSETIATFIANGAVELYHNNAKKAETVTGGFTVTGVCTATSFAGDGSSLSGINTDLVADTSPQLGGALDTNGNNINFGDSSDGSSDDVLSFGAGSDLRLYHDGSNSYIKQVSSGTGNLLIFADGHEIQLIPKSGEPGIKVINDGAVELYHNGSLKFETTSSGTRTTGAVHVNDGSATGNRISVGNGGDLKLFHTNPNSFIQDGSLALSISSARIDLSSPSGENMARFYQDAQVELYYNNVKQVETVAAGVKITGGDGHGLEITNGGTNLAAQLKLKNTTVTKQYTMGVAGNTGLNGQNSSLIFRDETAGVTRCEINTNGHFIPSQNNTYNLGSSGNRWANLFVNDLKMSNKGKQNDIDQTWGDYTIQEGYEDLFLINHRTGKKFKFNLTEVG